MVNEERNSDSNKGNPTIDISSSEANTSKLLGQDDNIPDADPVDDIEIDTTATANARKRRTIKHRKLSKTKAACIMAKVKSS